MAEGGALKRAPPLPLPCGLFCWGFSGAVAAEIRHAARKTQRKSHDEKHQADCCNDLWKKETPVRSFLPVCGDHSLVGSDQETLVDAESVF